MKENTLQKKYYYPELSRYDLGWLRISGPGLANCLFIAARAYIESQINKGEFVEPTWNKLSIGPWLRWERDKRHYLKLFTSKGVSGLKKIILILQSRLFPNKKVIKISGLGRYFEDLYEHDSLARNYVISIIDSKAVKKVILNELQKTVAVHVRLGDYPESYRTPIKWYLKIISLLAEKLPELQFLVFSDGTDGELADILTLPNTQRAFYGNAIADMYAMSNCSLVVAADSTFSAWAAFLGKRPVIFRHRHFPAVFPPNTVPEYVLGDTLEIPRDIMDYIQLNCK